MENAPFSWVDERSESLTSTEIPQPLVQSKLAKYKAYFPLVALLLGLLVLYFTRSSHGSPSPDAANTQGDVVEVIMPLMPVARGQGLDFTTFETVALRAKSLSASQLLKVVRSDHVQNLQGRLKAKKNLAPHQVVFWPDLEIISRASAPAPITIRYAN